MSVNKFRPHLFVLPEDDANRQVANGFTLDQFISQRAIHVLEEAGGWNEVLERFCSTYAPEMERFPARLMVLVIDFDGNLDRLDTAKKRVPSNLRERVFVLGALSEPEDLRHDLGSYEQIGMAMAKDCREETTVVWSHKMLSHNEAEVGRLKERARAFLFPAWNEKA